MGLARGRFYTLVKAPIQLLPLVEKPNPDPYPHAPYPIPMMIPSSGGGGHSGGNLCHAAAFAAMDVVNVVVIGHHLCDDMSH